MAKNLKTLLRNIFKIDVQEDTMLLGIAYDSRKALPGECFCAYPGAQADGRAFIDSAIENGATAVLLENDISVPTPEWRAHNGKRIPIYKVQGLQENLGKLAAWYYGYPSLNTKVIGVTGTNGKTSYCHLLASALSAMGHKTAILGSLGVGFIGQLTSTENTTLNAVENQKLLAKFRDQGTEYVVMEVSSHALDQGRVNGIYFTLTAFTNLTQDHLDYHKTFEAYAKAKEKLFSNGVPSVVNVDDKMGQALYGKLEECMGYSIQHQTAMHNMVYATEYACTESGVVLDFDSPEGTGRIRSPLIGVFNVSNLLAALGSLIQLGMDLDKSASALSQALHIPGRMESFGGKGQPVVFVDYAHTPDALKNALVALKPLCQEKLYCVFGCGGDRDKDKRSQMASIAQQYADHVILTSDNPRTEDPKAIIEDMKQGLSGKTYQVEIDRTQAIKQALDAAKPGDIILLAGKGREPYQEIGQEKIPYSDVVTVTQELEDRACLTD